MWGWVQCHPGVRLGQTQTKGPIVGTGGDGDSHHLYFVSSDGLLQRMRFHTGCFCASRNMCVCLTEAFVPSMGQPRSDEQWWEDLGADTHCGLTMMVGGGRWTSCVGGDICKMMFGRKREGIGKGVRATD